MRATALVAFALLVGCGEERGALGASCSSDQFCDSKKKLICHPLAKICVQGCQTGADCPETAKSCGALTIGDGGASPTFCQCQGTSLCKADGVICAEEEKICLPKCQSDVDCTFGRRCDKNTGNCRS